MPQSACPCAGTLLSGTYCYGTAVCSHSGENGGGTSLFSEQLFERCVDVLTEGESLYPQESQSERKRGERDRLTVQLVVKCSASKPNRSWKQKPFSKSHSHTPPPFLLSLLFFFFSVAVFWMPLSTSHICLYSEFTILQWQNPPWMSNLQIAT